MQNIKYFDKALVHNSQDPLEVTLVHHHQSLSVSIDFADVALVSEDTFRGLY